MAANVETMMYVREKPWHGLGVEVSEAPNSEDALRFAGLDWNVRQENVFNSRGGVIKGFKANVRVCMTPVRVVCNNTLNVALATAKRTWSMRHTENVHERLNEARDCLFRAEDYMDGLAQYADMAANKTIQDDEIREILNELFPVTDKTSEREKTTIDKIKDEFMICYFAPDIRRFRGTAWGAINAISDLVTHSMPHRNTKTYQENTWNKVMSGHVLLDRMAALCMK